MTLHPRRVRATLLLIAALALAAVGGSVATTALRAATAEPAPVVRTALAETRDPAGAKGRTLGLSRVTVAPGAELALHRHPGTQIAQIARGTLTYWVVRGAVEIRRGDPDSAAGAKLVRTIGAGQRGQIRTGDWIVEKPGTIHHAANRGKVEIEILIATLFKNGAPPSIAVRG
ncbi:hypothetical protein [Conexibacter arvalis]|uniref:Quercetin dioxygenase-like cupin family protein n=1 Tax=Conexibacter arvalis TaxID=912552 RepID=A0A840IGA4_9ACTN|nr:hypothetical protein [Conexibacter arvalis]MBB4663826.1 quercetin dioxygenase-like cupin family protein [Conexibacter arvalis]